VIRVVAVLAAITMASTCGSAPASSPSGPAADAGAIPFSDGGSVPVAACAAARQHMVEMSCPPPEDAFGGWVVECSGWAQSSVITSCVLKQTVCDAAHLCLGD